VSADSPTDVWAVGDYTPAGDSVTLTLILHGDGTRWSKVPSPNPGGTTIGDSELYAVSALSPTDAWAVGQYDGLDRRLILHWNGSAWSQT
jgi:hypothetical protein